MIKLPNVFDAFKGQSDKTNSPESGPSATEALQQSLSSTKQEAGQSLMGGLKLDLSKLTEQAFGAIGGLFQKMAYTLFEKSGPLQHP
jgi:hypothetical protein